MKSNLNLKINKLTLVLFAIILILSIIVTYQSNIINKLNNKQLSEIFLEIRVARDQSTANTLKTLKTLIDTEKVSKETKDLASSKYIEIALGMNNESKIESIIKSKGYQDVVVSIADNSVRVIVRSNKNLNNNQLKQIQDIVRSIIKVENIEIETKL